MGCASSKQKRTKSLDDIQAGIKESAANGQITNDANIKKNVTGDSHHSTNPIQIPGANKSFLAPDGIPFIDEDVEEEDMRVRSGKIDINENTREEKIKSALVVGKDQKSKVQVTINSTDVSSKESQEPKGKVTLSDEEAATKIQAGVRGFLDRKKIYLIKQNLVKVETKAEEIKPKMARTPKYDENTAATKIQASYKGYKTRKHLHN